MLHSSAAILFFINITTRRGMHLESLTAGQACASPIITVMQAEQFSRACGREQMFALLDAGEMPDALMTTAYVLLEGVFDALRERDLLWPDHLRLATFGDAQLLDFLPMPVNSISQQHERIAGLALQLALRAIEQRDYQPGITAVERQLRLRGK